jgi:hypothetical protein
MTTREAGRTPPPVRIHARVANRMVRGALERAEQLTPYVVETIAEDVAHAGPGARLDVALPRRADARTLAAVRDVFASLRARGVTVRVHRNGHVDRRRRRAAALRTVSSAARPREVRP